MEAIINKLLRPNIKTLKGYAVWRDQYLDDTEVLFLDNGENNYGSPLGKGMERYPSSSQAKLKQALAEFKQLGPDQIVLGNGSDELIDVLMRCVGEPFMDQVLVCEPTFGMFRQYAQINNLEVVNVPLVSPGFNWDVNGIKKAINPRTKLIFICSPNNPTGGSLPLQEVMEIAIASPGLVVVDEAYIDFSEKVSALALLKQLPNLVVLQTFSKAWGLAGLRLGVAYTSAAMASVLNLVRPPFNVSAYAQQQALQALAFADKRMRYIRVIQEERTRMREQLMSLPYVAYVPESDANSLLVKVNDAETLYNYLLSKKILISNRSSQQHCSNYVRITIGTVEENERLWRALNEFSN